MRRARRNSDDTSEAVDGDRSRAIRHCAVAQLACRVCSPTFDGRVAQQRTRMVRARRDRDRTSNARYHDRGEPGGDSPVTELTRAVQPQHFTLPMASNAHECDVPALIATAPARPLTATGVEAFVVVLLPS